MQQSDVGTLLVPGLASRVVAVPTDEHDSLVGDDVRRVTQRRANVVACEARIAAPTDNTYAPRPVIPDLPGYIAKALKAHSKAWEFFRELAHTYRRDFVVWIHTAKRAETRERRIQESIRLLAAGKKLGLK